MAEMSEDEQRQQVDEVANRVATKLASLYETLAGDERDLLGVALTQGPNAVDADDGAGYAARAVAAAFAAQADVRGHAMMIGGHWFSPPGEESRHPVPPNSVGGFGYNDTPRMPRTGPGRLRDD